MKLQKRSIALGICLLVVVIGLAFYFTQVRGPLAAAAAYDKAESLYAERDFAYALRAYQHVEADFAASEWADNSLFKEGFILANFLTRPREAVQKFESLVRRYPESSFCGDALLKAAEIYEHSLKEPQQAARAYERAKGYAKDQARLAEAELGRSRCYLAMGDRQVFRACQGLIKKFHKYPNVMAETLYIMGRAYQTIAKDSASAQEQYARLIKNYPETVWADKAEQERAWLAYERTEHARKARVMLELPPSAEPKISGFREVALAGAVFPKLLGESADYSESLFLALSGEAFQFFYAPDNPALGTCLFYENPFSAVCDSLGLPHTYQAFGDREAARKELKRFLFKGHPVVTSMVVPPPSWVILIGTDGIRGEFYVHDPYTKYHKTYSSSEFNERWGTTQCPRVVIAGQSPGPKRVYPIFVLTGTKPKRSLKEAITLSLRRALRNLTPKKELGVSAGLDAYQALIQQLEASQKFSSKNYLQTLASWNSQASAHLSACREAAAVFLEQAAQEFDGSARQHLRDAAEDFLKVVNLLKKARDVMPDVETVKMTEAKEIARNPDRLGKRFLDAARSLRDAREYERSGLEHIKRAISE